jgi:succinate dehydrogenase hydrophobic anchor subunit
VSATGDATVVDEGSDVAVDEGSDASLGEGAGAWSTRWQHAAGLVVFLYLVVTMLEYAVASLSPSTYSRVLRWHADLPVQLLGCLAVVAVLGHALSGIRTMLLEWIPPIRRRVGVLNAAAVFVLLALGLPLCALVLRPWLEAHVL